MKQNYKTIGIYVPSYKRSDRIKTYRLLNSCTYVVRESEASLYKDAGVDKLWSVPDHLIDSFPKVRNYIIENAPEDIVVQMDDDIDTFFFQNKICLEELKDKDAIDAEIERIAQIISDLQIGMAAMKMQANVVKYTQEFYFKGIVGQIVWYNKEAIKSKYDVESPFKADIDFELQELLHNRIIFVPAYLAVKAKYDKNKGGNNTTKTKTALEANVDYLRTKWGKYFDFNYKGNQPKLNVKR